MSHRVRVFEHGRGDWWAECLVCGKWVSASNASRRDAEHKAGRHLANEPHVFRGRVIEALRELANASEQRRLWLSGGGEVSSFVECVCHLFDDSGLGDVLDRGGIVFDEATDGRLRRLSTALSAVDSNRPPSEVIEDRAMIAVRALADEILRDLTSA